MKGAPSSSRRTTRRKGPRARAEDDDIPEIFREMVAEDAQRAQSSVSLDRGEERPLKRRRMAGAGGTEAVKLERTASSTPQKEETAKVKAKAVDGPPEPADDDPNNEEMGIETGVDSGNGFAVDESEGEDEDEEDESDADWEEVDLSTQPISLFPRQATPPSGPLELVLNDPDLRKSAGPSRRTITAVDRRIRLETHKLHLICLLQHLRIRNRWCNDETVQDNLLTVLPDKADALLNHDPTDQQFRRSKLFLEGLQMASDAFRKAFKITYQGMVAPQWMDQAELKSWKSPANREGPMTKEEFQRISEILSGSRDTGAQLFCAMLRGAGVTARLVSSLQVLPFGFNTKNTPRNATGKLSEFEVPSSSPTTTPKRLQPSLRRLPVTSASPSQLLHSPSTFSAISSISIVESPFPVYWTEAWSPAAQKWIPVDPLTTHTIGKPLKLSPPLSDSLNTLSYVFGADETSHLADVTRRYAPQFTAKTRKLRVESTKGGARWYRRLINRCFSRGYPLDRDQIEEAELSARELAEPMPRNVQDLKGHPLYALKRHLRRDEVIHPERKIGTITVGHGKHQTAENVYRRQDVKIVKTADQWYRLGREVLADQEGAPLKFTQPRKMTGQRNNRSRQYDDDDGDERDRNLNGEEIIPDQPMYAFSQTMLFAPPPVVLGLVPKNSFGNIDLFVPTMLPEGASHIPHPLASQAARILGIDAAGAVTGFQFNGRNASPVMKGIVVAEEYAEAVAEVVKGLEWEMEREMRDEKAERALEMWRRWYMRLRIRKRLGIESEKRVEDDSGDREKQTELPEAQPMDGDYEDGGFMRQDDRETGDIYVHRDDDGGRGGFFPGPSPAADQDMGGGFFPEPDDDHGGGGFIVDDPDPSYGSGGFLPAGETSPPHKPSSTQGAVDTGCGFLLDMEDQDTSTKPASTYSAGCVIPDIHQLPRPHVSSGRSNTTPTMSLESRDVAASATHISRYSVHNTDKSAEEEGKNTAANQSRLPATDINPIQSVGAQDSSSPTQILNSKQTNHDKDTMSVEGMGAVPEVTREPTEEEEDEEEEGEEDPDFDNPDTDWI